MTEKTYDVVAKVTLEQYDSLKVNSSECQMILETDFRVWGEDDIPEFVQGALLCIVSEDNEPDEWNGIESIYEEQMEKYIRIVQQWPAETKAKILELCHCFIGYEIEIRTVIEFATPSKAEAQALIGAFPLLRDFFSADLDDMVTWFR